MNLAKFFDPLRADRPCGDDLSFSAEFDRIQEARREDDPTVDYGEWQTTLKQADWNEVVSACTELLLTRSKDLRVAAWLSEGLVKQQGLAGLADGIVLTTGLVETFGDALHPQASEGDQEHRIGALSWFAMRMTKLAREVALTRAASGAFSLVDHESAVQWQRGVEPESESETRPTPEKIAAAAAGTDKSLYRQWIADVERCIRLLPKLESACDRLFVNDGPSFAHLARSLDAIQMRLQSIGNDIGLFAAEPEPTPRQTAEPARGDMPVYAQQASIMSREQALESLRQVAAFFRHAEPHSPVAYLADKAAQWGAMPLHSWLRSVVKDSGTLSHLEEMLGVKEDAGNDR